MKSSGVFSPVKFGIPTMQELSHWWQVGEKARESTNVLIYRCPGTTRHVPVVDPAEGPPRTPPPLLKGMLVYHKLGSYTPLNRFCGGSLGMEETQVGWLFILSFLKQVGKATVLFEEKQGPAG